MVFIESLFVRASVGTELVPYLKLVFYVFKKFTYTSIHTHDVRFVPTVVVVFY